VSVQASEHPLRRWWIATVLVAAIAVALSLAVLTLKRPSNGPMTQQQTPQASMARVLQPKRVGASAEIADRTRQPPAAESLHRQSRRQRVRNQRKRIRAQHARKAYGRLNIQATDGSEPRAVIVVLDGQVVGETPLQLNRIKVGKHFVTVRRDGYGVKRRVVRIDRGQTKTLLFELQRLDRRPEDRSPQ